MSIPILSKHACDKPMKTPRSLLVALLFAALFASGCLVHAAQPGLPQAPIVVKSAPPSAAHIWVKGHYRWQNGRYVWKKGRWIVRVAGKVWVKGHYVRVKRGRVVIKRWVPGHWKTQRVVVKRPRPTLVMRPLPARPKVVRTARPQANVVWVQGHYAWSNGRYTWRKGRWVPRVIGKRWVPGKYVWHRRGAFKVKAWIPGHWRKISVPQSSTIVVRPLPARPPRSVRPIRPAHRVVWAKGHYVWRNGRYVYVPGRWVKRLLGKKWVPGHYRVVRRGNVRIKMWVKGRWS